MVLREKEETKQDNMPFTKFLFSYIKKVKKCSEKDDFRFDDLIEFLETLKMIQENDIVSEELTFYGLPTDDNHKDESVKMREVCAFLIEFCQDIQSKG